MLTSYELEHAQIRANQAKHSREKVMYDGHVHTRGSIKCWF